jgi:hypothetical protein
MMNDSKAAMLVGVALALYVSDVKAVAPATNCQLPSVEEQLAHPISAIVQDGGADSFIIITLADSAPDCTIANGTYRGWHFQFTGPAPVSGMFSPVLYSSHAALPNGALKADWAAVNYLLNHQAGTPREVQRALWMLLGGRLPGAAEEHFPFTPAVEAMVLEAVTLGDRFLPAPGQVSAILLATGQPARWVLIEAVLPSGVERESAITDLLWDDLNGDAAWQPGEPVLPDSEVWLTDGAGRFVASAVTGRDGFFVLPFRAVLPGEFRLHLPTHINFGQPCMAFGELDPNGFTAAFGIGTDGMFFPLANPAALVGDRVWADLDHNGLQDDGEPGVAGVIVQLWQGGILVAQTNTDDFGCYRFAGLSSGKYSIRVTSPAGYAFTKPHAGSTPEGDSDLDPATGRIDCELVAGRDDLSRDAGLLPVCVLSGRAWLDSNRNGRLDAGDRGLAGVTVTLLDSTGKTLRRTTTGADGRYVFDNLLPGACRVTFASTADFERVIVRTPRGITLRSSVVLAGQTATGIASVWRKRATSITRSSPARTGLRPVLTR